METMLRRMARMLSWHSLLVHQPLEVSTSSRHTEARVALHIERYNIYSIYTIYTIYRVSKKNWDLNGNCNFLAYGCFVEQN